MRELVIRVPLDIELEDLEGEVSVEIEEFEDEEEPENGDEEDGLDEVDEEDDSVEQT
jgi:hypothetical protein